MLEFAVGCLHRYRPPLSQRSLDAHAAAGGPCAAAHISIRMPPGQPGQLPSEAPAFQLPMPQVPGQQQQQLRMATGACATLTQLHRQASDPQEPCGDWLKTRRQDPAGVGACLETSSRSQPHALEPWQQQQASAAQFCLPLTAAQSQQIVSRLHAVQPPAAQQQTWGAQPTASQPLNIADWQPSATAPAWPNLAAGDMAGMLPSSPVPTCG